MEDPFKLIFASSREKAELWKKADDMEFEIKVKADDRWMDDSEVSHCLGCKAEFSFLLRKVRFQRKTMFLYEPIKIFDIYINQRNP